MIFGNEIIKENQNIELVDLYEYMIDSIKEEQEFFNECIISDFMEVKYIREGLEYINEGFIDTAKKYINKLLEGLKKLYKKIMTFINDKIKKNKEFN